MRTVTLQVRDDRLEQFLKIIEALKDDMVDAYALLPEEEAEYLFSAKFQQDRKLLHSRLEDIRTGRATLLTEDVYQEKMKEFTTELKQRYADS